MHISLRMLSRRVGTTINPKDSLIVRRARLRTAMLRTLVGHDFGNLVFSVRFKVLAPQEAKPSITDDLVRCYGQFAGLENSLDQYRPRKLAGPFHHAIARYDNMLSDLLGG
jgi:hypothetical protein